MRFLVETRFKQALTDELMALIPAETARGKELDAQGIRLALYVAADLSAAWQVLQADSVADVQKVMETFPLHPFSIDTITPLMEA
jgi:muconolactone delta-isomerase